MHPLLNIGVRAARRAGDIIVRHLDRVDALKVESKQANDFVTEVDRLAERDIIETILKSYPAHSFLGEESGLHGESDEHVWVIDPLDGTTNFLHNFPVFAVSIGYRYRGRVEHGIIYDPMRQELFTASRGGGAQLDERRIRVSQRRTLEGALIGTGFPFREHSRLDVYMRTLDAVIRKTAGVRRPGAAALDLAYVAAGRLDGFWEMGLKEWDVAAGALMIQEAGGIVGNLSGGPDYLPRGDIMAGNPKLFAALARELRPHLAETE